MNGKVQAIEVQLSLEAPFKKLRTRTPDQGHPFGLIFPRSTESKLQSEEIWTLHERCN